MKLSTSEATLFFSLYHSLMVHACRKLIPSRAAITVRELERLGNEEKLMVRDTVFERIELIDEFVRENPFAMSAENLAIVKSWECNVRGDFYIERYLARQTIFILDETVYGVVGLYDRIEDVMAPRHPPVLVRAILLPFKGKILYDGLLQSHPILFGDGFRAVLGKTYMEARQSGQIVTSLEPARPDLI